MFQRQRSRWGSSLKARVQNFRRIVDLPSDPKEAINVIARGHTAVFDAMHVAYRDINGGEQSRYAINVTSIGMGGAVAERIKKSSRPLGSTLACLTATAAVGLSFPAREVSIQADDDEPSYGPITNVAIGNGQYQGAGMRGCPRAVTDDGLLDVTIKKQLSIWEILVNLPTLFNGRIYSHPKVHHRRGRILQASLPHVVPIEIDGEPLGQLPLEISVLPRAIRMLVP
jgi:diacylglycerol kinase (ATP)